jgi:hypothetical protein
MLKYVLSPNLVTFLSLYQILDMKKLLYGHLEPVIPLQVVVKFFSNALQQKSI